MERRLPTLLLLGVAVAYFVDMFLPWTKAAFPFSAGAGATGWSSVPAWSAALLSIVLVVWQLFRLIAIRLVTPAVERVVAAFLGTTIGFLAGSGVAYLRFGVFGASSRITFAYGAWIAVVLAAVLIVASFLELKAHDPELPARLRAIRVLPPVGSALDE